MSPIFLGRCMDAHLLAPSGAQVWRRLRESEQALRVLSDCALNDLSILHSAVAGDARQRRDRTQPAPGYDAVCEKP